MINLNKDTVECSTVSFSEKAANKQPLSYSDMRICYVAEGSAEWQIENRKHSIHKGDIILLHSRQKRYFTKHSDNFSLFVIMLKRQAFLGTYHRSFFMKLIKEKRYIIKDEKLLSLLKELFAENNGKRLNYYEVMSAKLTEFFVTAERSLNFALKDIAETDEKMIEILDHIDSNIGQHLTLKQMADMAGLTESSFSRLFSKVNSISFRQYLIEKRVEYAMYLLDSTDMNVIDISLECGFSSISGFYDAFKKVTGTTPKLFIFHQRKQLHHSLLIENPVLTNDE